MRQILSMMSKSYRHRNKMLADIAQQLKKENLVDFDLRGTEIQQIVDFHSHQGFDIKELLAGAFRKFQLVELENMQSSGLLLK